MQATHKYSVVISPVHMQIPHSSYSYTASLRVLTLRPRAGSSKTTGSKVRLMRQWSMLSLPWMVKKRVCASTSSATYQQLLEVACALVTERLFQVDSRAAITVAMDASAVLREHATSHPLGYCKPQRRPPPNLSSIAADGLHVTCDM